MTLLQLKYAMVTQRTGSMNRAAEELFISQPTLSSAIRELEVEIGIKIFNRTSRGVILTREGAEFMRDAHRVLQDYELLQNKYADHRNSRRKFGVSTQHYSFVDKAFVEMVKRFDPLYFDFALRETRTAEVISDVGEYRSEVGILFRSDYNHRVIDKLLKDNDLEFHRLIECSAYVYLWKKHPLAGQASISLEELREYPCLTFEQGDTGSTFMAEEILSENEYPRTIRTSDRATMLNLMVGLYGFTLCSGIICEELNGSDFIAVPYREDETNRNMIMEIGYIKKKNLPLSEIAEVLLEEMKKYLKL